MTNLRLDRQETDRLLSIPTKYKSGGGFQNFICNLAGRVDPNNGAIALAAEEVKRIQRYITRYTTGGYQSQLWKIFSRPLNLKRPPKKKK
jgi:hypothetical protein